MVELTYLSIKHHGRVDGGTGSCYALLVDAGYLAHADKPSWLRFVKAMLKKPKESLIKSFDRIYAAEIVSGNWRDDP